MPKSRPALLFIVALALLASGAAQAQYKWVESNGRIGYGDRLPSHNVKILKSPATLARTTAGNDAGEFSNGDLPYELRNATRSSPVTLYTTPNCGPCDMARDHLRNRGVPYGEKVVSSSRDIQAFEALGFPTDSGLPLITAGSAQEVGYQGVRWDDLLTRAGYPKKSVLPSDYRGPAAQSLASSNTTGNIQPGSLKSNVLAQQRNSPYGKPAQQSNLRF